MQKMPKRVIWNTCQMEHVDEESSSDVRVVQLQEPNGSNPDGIDQPKKRSHRPRVGDKTRRQSI
eukprot:3130611-Amphidinium_carterae.1